MLPAFPGALQTQDPFQSLPEEPQPRDPPQDTFSGFRPPGGSLCPGAILAPGPALASGAPPSVSDAESSLSTRGQLPQALLTVRLCLPGIQVHNRVGGS